ncbi:MAG: GntR family transcriptional regulator [Betaproteobacteria bacterium]|nr:GntR family transcriptional regulator [Betaproteobacteria bacterium]MBU6511537.1 GntR family transcriptional regulator [Betaproteobacteria bacterium]MDE1955009.1 GntR family transcriptional regulator [Betaproteobacteria bacterium]MDE2151113.1 GntR family transcriptional regulator [Betaproteobacteria bacterium]MDE2477646.1 GntR family transcriptional regulator [Betaproteobacteria bacterium]
MSQDSVHILSTLRRLISEGRYAPGERMAEIPVAEQLGVSRTPVRLAFRTLEQEGLLEKAGARGYVVRRFSEQDVMGGLEVRGVLEGLAARRLGEQGLPQATRQLLRDCVEQGARLLAPGELSPGAIAGWSEINARFHHAIIDASASRAIADAIARNDHLPFASSDSIIIDTSRLAQEYEKLRVAQLQHSLVLDALLAGEAARAEMLMREHAYIGLRYGRVLGLRTPV